MSTNGSSWATRGEETIELTLRNSARRLAFVVAATAAASVLLPAPPAHACHDPWEAQQVCIAIDTDCHVIGLTVRHDEVYISDSVLGCKIPVPW